MSGYDIRPILAVLQAHVGGCREELGAPTFEKCWEAAEYVLWGKLIPAEGLGPRCHKHARQHISEQGLEPRSGYALIRLADLAYDICDATDGAA